MSSLSTMDIKWYSKYVFLVGTILSLADPITDILTLVEFYRTDHKTWFAVGLCFVVLPWVPYGIYYAVLLGPNFVFRGTCNAWFLVGFNPFSSAVARLKMFFICLKNVNKTIGISDEVKENGKLLYSQVTSFFEAVLESAPQFVIQFYVMSVQDAPVSIIQMISLPVSFLSLVWTFTSTEVLWKMRELNDDICKIKHKVLLFVTHLFQLSSRLIAVSYFTISYKWWIISFLMFHSIIMVIVGYICFIRQKLRFYSASKCFLAVYFFGKFCAQWIKDDVPLFPLDDENRREVRIRWFSDVLFGVENLLMILLFYFSGSRHSNTWYALPVTVCVCSFTVLGTIMRITHFYFLYKEKPETINVPPPMLNFSDKLLDFRYCYESAV